jgi:hypothetical protein
MASATSTADSLLQAAVAEPSRLLLVVQAGGLLVARERIKNQARVARTLLQEGPVLPAIAAMAALWEGSAMVVPAVLEQEAGGATMAAEVVLTLEEEGRLTRLALFSSTLKATAVAWGTVLSSFPLL